MKNKLSAAALLATIFFAGINAAGAGEIQFSTPASPQDWLPCTVSDPTGTPLNVRAKPNGRIITTLKNGTLVEIDDSTAGGKWSRISFLKSKKATTGWVLRAYLSCQ